MGRLRLAIQALILLSVCGLSAAQFNYSKSQLTVARTNLVGVGVPSSGLAIFAGGNLAYEAFVDRLSALLRLCVDSVGFYFSILLLAVSVGSVC
jgi:hypothetical protein